MNTKFLYLVVLYITMCVECGHSYKILSQNDNWDNSNENLRINGNYKQAGITREQTWDQYQHFYPQTWEEYENSIKRAKKEKQNVKEEIGEQHDNLKDEILGEYNLKQNQHSKYLSTQYLKAKMTATHQLMLRNKKITSQLRPDQEYKETLRIPVKISRPTKQYASKTRYITIPEYKNYLDKNTPILSSTSYERDFENYQRNENRRAPIYYKIQNPIYKRRNFLNISHNKNSPLGTYEYDSHGSSYSNYHGKQQKVTDWSSYHNNNNNYIDYPEKAANDERIGYFNRITKEEPQISEIYQIEKDAYNNLSEKKNNREYKVNGKNNAGNEETRSRKTKKSKKHKLVHEVNDTEDKDDEFNSLFKGAIRLLSQQDKEDDSSSEDGGNYYFGETPRLKVETGNEDSKIV